MTGLSSDLLLSCFGLGRLVGLLPGLGFFTRGFGASFQSTGVVVPDAVAGVLSGGAGFLLWVALPLAGPLGLGALSNFGGCDN
ncbi:MAG: hypothetical protein R6V38_07030, partial [Roseovarius gahaiensis]